MLALRLVLIGHGDEAPRTLVFDEVDAGIGGTAATAVGRALAEVGGAPPGARRHPPRPGRGPGDDAGRGRQARSPATTTVATAGVVDGDQRVAELARMLSGDDGGDAARRHAVELLDG